MASWLLLQKENQQTAMKAVNNLRNPGKKLQTVLPSSWLQLLSSPEDGMVCSLCTKYNKVPRSGKPIWTHEPCTLFRLQSVHRHSSSQMHCDAERQELDRQLSIHDGGISCITTLN